MSGLSSKKTIGRSRSRILVKYMTQRIDDEASHKFLKNMSVEVAEHLKLMDFDTLSARITKVKPDLLKDDFQPIFVAKGKTVSETDWGNRLIDNLDGSVDKFEGLQEFITTTLDKYITKNRKYKYNDLPYRLFRIAELYECSDADVEKRLEIYKSGVKKYLVLAQKDKTTAKELELWKLDKLQDKIDNPDPNCNHKFTKTGVCPVDLYYGPFDILDESQSTDLSNHKMESLADYLLDDTSDDSCYKHNHLRQYVIGNLKDTIPLESVNKYFHPEPSIVKLIDKYPEITWNPSMNDVYIKCLLEHIFNQIDKPLFPLRIYTDDRYINIGKHPKVSRYDYVPKDELDKMKYLGCFLVPVYGYFFEVQTKTGEKIINYIEPSTSINGSVNIEAEFRKDITTHSKTCHEEMYISRLNSMVNEFTNGDPNERLTIQMDNSDFDQIHAAPENTTRFRIKRRDIRQTVMVYAFHLFNKDDNYIMINYRSNIVEPGFILERYKFLYIEMIQMYYILTRIYKQPTFRLYRYSDTNLFFFSPYYDNGLKHSAENEFEKKKSKLLSELEKTSAGVLQDKKYNINITTATLTQFYDKLVPYDVLINGFPSKSIFLQQVNKLGGGTQINGIHSTHKKGKSKQITHKKSNKNMKTQLYKSQKNK
jgi:hypothetical protein